MQCLSEIESSKENSVQTYEVYCNDDDTQMDPFQSVYFREARIITRGKEINKLGFEEKKGDLSVNVENWKRLASSEIDVPGGGYPSLGSVEGATREASCIMMRS
jgi:hypothetical protein